MNQSISQPNFWNEDLFGIGPAHYVDLNKQRRDNYIRTIFTQLIEGDALWNRKRTEFLIIIAKKFQGKRFSFLALRKRKYFIDVSA